MEAAETTPDDGDASAATWAQLSLGMLGLPALGQLQTESYAAVGAAKPKGWCGQISAGGEPTLRYALAKQYLLSGAVLGAHEWSWSYGLSAGYITKLRGGPARRSYV